MTIAPQGNQNLVKRSVVGFLWSLTQSFGSKAVQFPIFLFLARILDPDDFGKAVFVATGLLLLSAISEFGFGEAIIQKKNIVKIDLNLPFHISMSISLVISAIFAIFSNSIEEITGMNDIQSLIWIGCLILPITTASNFQEALYKRSLNFKILALRQLICLVISGVTSIIFAIYGFGAASLLVQQLVFISLSCIWLWVRSDWRPSLKLEIKSFVQLSRYSIAVLANRLVDLFTVRSIDLLILSSFGPIALGAYAVGSRVYSTVLQIFVSALADVSLSALSKIASDRDLMSNVYLRTSKSIGFLSLPFFLYLSALSDEYTMILFGQKWAISGPIMGALTLLGAIQCVQFINGSYFSALGKPYIPLALNIVKFFTVAGTLILAGSNSVHSAVNWFAFSQLVTAPISFGLICFILKISPLKLFTTLAPFIFSALASYSAVLYFKDHIVNITSSTLLQITISTFIFFIVYAIFCTLTARQSMSDIYVELKILTRRR